METPVDLLSFRDAFVTQTLGPNTGSQLLGCTLSIQLLFDGDLLQEMDLQHLESFAFCNSQHHFYRTSEGLDPIPTECTAFTVVLLADISGAQSTTLLEVNFLQYDEGNEYHCEIANKNFQDPRFSLSLQLQARSTFRKNITACGGLNIEALMSFLHHVIESNVPLPLSADRVHISLAVSLPLEVETYIRLLLKRALHLCSRYNQGHGVEYAQFATLAIEAALAERGLDALRVPPPLVALLLFLRCNLPGGQMFLAESFEFLEANYASLEEGEEGISAGLPLVIGNTLQLYTQPNYVAVALRAVGRLLTRPLEPTLEADQWRNLLVHWTLIACRAPKEDNAIMIADLARPFTMLCTSSFHVPYLEARSHITDAHIPEKRWLFSVFITFVGHTDDSVRPINAERIGIVIDFAHQLLLFMGWAMPDLQGADLFFCSRFKKVVLKLHSSVNDMDEVRQRYCGLPEPVFLERMIECVFYVNHIRLEVQQQSKHFGADPYPSGAAQLVRNIVADGLKAGCTGTCCRLVHYTAAAVTARALGLPETLQAYHLVMDTLDSTRSDLGYAPIQDGYKWSGHTDQLASEAISYALESGLHDVALEWAERSRSTIWTRVLRLRLPDEILAVNPKLAAQLFEVASKLSETQLSTSFSFQDTCIESGWEELD
ncbi:hypothetical protein BDN72DRAFT_896569 [Pluteus cervinus]|uniref:Uncharacterized protein n=1 Tax=Pluteus cervinus TaxID=181527 RepID=A0ACD3AYG4_9AGAR|nr:hypothetical protein BDN72DRAFT_896569 [Pluteus cervinus]